MRYSTEQLADIEAIRDTAHRYCHGVDRLDAEVMRSAYWPEATDNHGAFNGNAWEFVDHCMVGHLRWRSTMHCILNHWIQLDPGGMTARGEVYNVTYLFRGEPGGGDLDTWWGRYLDRYERRGDDWRIIERVCVHEATRSAPIDTPMGIGWQAFRQGDFDRPANGRPIGS